MFAQKYSVKEFTVPLHTLQSTSIFALLTSLLYPTHPSYRLLCEEETVVQALILCPLTIYLYTLLHQIRQKIMLARVTNDSYEGANLYDVIQLYSQ